MVYPLNVVSLCNTVSVIDNQMKHTIKSYHIVDATEDPVASIPVAQDTGVVFRLVSCQIFLA